VTIILVWSGLENFVAPFLLDRKNGGEGLVNVSQVRDQWSSTRRIHDKSIKHKKFRTLLHIPGANTDVGD